MSNESIYCDHCGDEVTEVEDMSSKNIHVVSCLPVPVSSANQGESATLCGDCHWFVAHSPDITKQNLR